MSISANKPALPAFVQKRVDQIANNAIKKASKHQGGALSELDVILKQNSLAGRTTVYNGDSVHINYSGGKIGG